jgi:metal-responsive CopG/Arc/MetJ family transcriptional regulator
MYSMMAIRIESRNTKAPKVQEILTEYGCIITTRVGFHETGDEACSTDGYIILQLRGEEKEIRDLYQKLEELEGVTPKMIDF